MKNLKNIIGDYDLFISFLLNSLAEKKVDIEKYYIDHLCYRTKTLDEYERKKKELLSFSKKYVENIHHERPISKFILKKDIQHNKFLISIIELPAPKKDIEFESGLEHLEIVVGDDYDFIKDKYKHLWDGSDDSGLYNQTIFIDFGKFKVKFHKYSLLKVLEMEKVKLLEVK